MYIHVLMLRRKFELIPIKFRFFYDFLKLLQKSLYYGTVILAKFRQKSKVENSPVLYFFFMHIHVLKLRRKFELISIKIGFLMIF